VAFLLQDDRTQRRFKKVLIDGVPGAAHSISLPSKNSIDIDDKTSTDVDDVCFGVLTIKV